MFPDDMPYAFSELGCAHEYQYHKLSAVPRIILELMARGGMRICEVPNLRSCDIQKKNLTIQNPKNKWTGRGVDVPRKLLVRLTYYVKSYDIGDILRLIV